MFIDMILSASRRTDIPCFYSEWFFNRLKAGYVLTRNPFNHAQIKNISLSPETIDCIIFWTKDAYNIMPYLEDIDKLGYKYYFQFTLTPYDSSVERNLRDKNLVEDTFIKLSKLIGKKRVLWRYDPIILNSVFDAEYHKMNFKRLCEKLSPYTKSVTISFVDTYSKVKTCFIREISKDEILSLSEYIGKTANNYGLTAKACCEEVDLSVYNIEKASCIDKNIIEKICGHNIIAEKDKNQRNNCGCVKSIDIGVYNTCINGCVYCYANHSPATALKHYNSHNPQNELLIGTFSENEKTIRNL